MTINGQSVKINKNLHMKHTALILIFFSLNSLAQNYEVVYKLEQTAKNINLTTNIKTFLKGDGKTSIYVEDFRNSYQEGGENLGIINIPTENNPTYIKELKSGVITYSDHIRFNFFNIVDVIGKFDWKVEGDTKEILGYKCQKAVVHFRGRDFIVYFSQEISATDGPLKFFGLPGLILEVISDDSTASFHYLAQSVSFPKAKLEIKNIYADKKKIQYAEYVELYGQKYKESLTRIINDEGETRPMAKGFMEFYIK
jgi:GLPGLI family protein